MITVGHGKDGEMGEIPKRSKPIQLNFDNLLQNREKKAVTSQ